jgi:lysine-ketoglutarate reductase/saccharopine dehydrogenase-like protein (TIGR00300 family)
MAFVLPEYRPPDFSSLPLAGAPRAVFAPAPAQGVVPDGFHATSNHPEYVHLESGWKLVPESRMDAVIVRSGDELDVVEARRVRKGDLVALGRTESGEEGLFLHTEGFTEAEAGGDKFGFRTRGTRETPFSRIYDDLYELLRYEREHGYIVWVAGPAVVFDKDSRDSFRDLIEAGFCHALLAGNAVATHDLEAGYYGTGLGQDVYSQKLVPGGHYHHLDVLNRVRRAGSIAQAIEEAHGSDGVMAACVKKGVPFVLAGSIRDDGPLPEVVSDVYQAQDVMRAHARRATTVITLATQLHSIAFGNMVPSYRVTAAGVVRPVYLTIVDITEFSADKLANRGSAQAIPIVTNVQDFMINLRFALVGGRGK